jgi:hypothetical protein
MWMISTFCKFAEGSAAEIKLRALRRLGELSKELEKAKPAGGKGNVVLPPGGGTKAETLAAAGISTQTKTTYLVSQHFERSGWNVETFSKACFPSK